MKRLLALCLGIASALLAVHGCAGGESGTGSKTNWLERCDAEAACGSAAVCLCGFCTVQCEDDSACGELPNGRCVSRTQSAVRDRCATPTRDVGAAGAANDGTATTTASGVCVQRCTDDAACGNDAVCVDGACTPLPDSNCTGAATLTLLTLNPEGTELQRRDSSDASAPPAIGSARVGSFLRETLVLPVRFASQPSDAYEPPAPLRYRALVTDDAGAPLSGCNVAFLTGATSGRALGATTTSSNGGLLDASWVAGDGAEQTLVVALRREQASPLVVRAKASARTHAQAPFAPVAEAAKSTRAVPAYLQRALDARASELTVEFTPVTFPAGTYYVPVQLEGFIAGLQNLATGSTSTAAQRVLHVTTPSIGGTSPSVLFTGVDVTCASATTAEGVACSRPDAWSVGGSQQFRVAWRSLASGAAAPSDYATLGYDPASCAAPAGCTDFTLFVQRAAGAEERVAALRWPSAAPSAFVAHYVDPFGDGALAPSCLATPRAELLLAARALVNGTTTALPTPTLAAVSNGWHDQLCANFGAERVGTNYRLITGGPLELDAVLPGGSRSIE